MAEPIRPRVLVYSTRYCGYCHAATGLLRARGIEFDTIDVTGDAPRRRWLATVTGRTTVPQIFIDGEPIGGYRELRGLDERGALARLQPISSDTAGDPARSS
jgi:glutaredoxin 3